MKSANYQKKRYSLMVGLLKRKIDFCSSVLDDSKTYIETFFANVDNQHVTHRLYNPKTYLFFEGEDAYKAMCSPVNHYHYIEVNAADIQDSYQVLLACDRMNGSEEESIEVFNSPYSIIMLRDSASEKIIGIMKPDDGISVDIKDEKEIYYRKYTPQTNGYEHEMFMAICRDEPFQYYPFLSDMTGGYDLPEHDEKELDSE